MATKTPARQAALYSPADAPSSQELSLCSCATQAQLGLGCPVSSDADWPGLPTTNTQMREAKSLRLCACTGKVFLPQPQMPKAAAVKTDGRRAGPFLNRRHRVRYAGLLYGLIVATLVIVALILTWGNNFEFLSDKWWRVSQMRISAVAVILAVTFAQALATVSFQTVTNNRIITPSIMGFESLFVLVQTAVVYFLGTSGLSGLGSVGQFLLQTAFMVGFAVLLYSWLLSGRLGNLHVMLLVGIVIGTGLGSLSTFMQRMLDPNEFDILRARLFANIGTAKTELLPLVLPIILVAGTVIWLLGRRLNVLALGQQISTNLGLNHRRQTMLILTLVSVLMAVSTALVGPMTFLGFLTATIAYSVTDTHDHRRILPVAWLTGAVTLGLAYLLLKHVFPMVDAVMIIVELLGGIVFLGIILKRGRL